MGRRGKSSAPVNGKSGIVPGIPSGPGPVPPPAPPKPAAAKLKNVVLSKSRLLYTLDKATKLTLRIQRADRGRTKGKACSTRARTGKRCTKLTTVITKHISAKRGAGHLTIPRGALRRGSYRVSLTPTGGKATTKSFTIK